MASLVRICHMVYDFQAGGFSPLINPTAINKSTKQWDSPYGDTHSLQGTTGCPTTILPCRKKSSPCTVLSLWVVELSFFEPLKDYLLLSKFSLIQLNKVFWLKFSKYDSNKKYWSEIHESGILLFWFIFSIGNASIIWL